MQLHRWGLTIGFSLLVIIGIGLIFWAPKELMNPEKEAFLTADLPAYFSPDTGENRQRKLATAPQLTATQPEQQKEQHYYEESVTYGDRHPELGEIIYGENNRFQDSRVVDTQLTRPDQYGFFEKSFLLEAKGGEIQVLARERWNKAKNGELAFHGTSYIAGNQLLVKIRPQANPAAAEQLFRQAGFTILHFSPHRSTYQLAFTPASARDYRIKIEQMRQHSDLIATAFPNLLIVQSRPADFFGKKP